MVVPISETPSRTADLAVCLIDRRQSGKIAHGLEELLAREIEEGQKDSRSDAVMARLASGWMRSR